MRRRLGRFILLPLALMGLIACSGEEPDTDSATSEGTIATTLPASTTTTSPPATAGGANPDGDADLTEVLATELEGGMLGPLPMSPETASCAAAEIVGSMEGGEGMSLEDYLASRGSEVEDETVDLVLASYFECSEAKEVGDALADDLIDSIGFPADEQIQRCLSERLDSADEVRVIMGLEDGESETGPASVLDGCVGLGDVMSVEISGLTSEEHACLNRDGEDVLAAMLGGEDDDASRQVLTTVLEGCGLDPGGPSPD